MAFVQFLILAVCVLLNVLGIVYQASYELVSSFEDILQRYRSVYGVHCANTSVYRIIFEPARSTEKRCGEMIVFRLPITPTLLLSTLFASWSNCHLLFSDIGHYQVQMLDLQSKKLARYCLRQLVSSAMLQSRDLFFGQAKQQVDWSFFKYTWLSCTRNRGISSTSDVVVQSSRLCVF